MAGDDQLCPAVGGVVGDYGFLEQTGAMICTAAARYSDLFSPFLCSLFAFGLTGPISGKLTNR